MTLSKMYLPGSMSKAVTFSEDTKKSEEGDVHDKNEPKENESTGVWFLKNKDHINEEILEKEAHEVFATEVPTKFHAEPEVIAAKEAELDRWKEYKAYEEIEFDNQHILTTRWVITEKDGGKIKGRLCVRGFQEKIYPQSDSPTALKDSFKTFLAIAANESFEIKTLDVTAAFLQGHPLERDVFVWPPPERAEEGLVWKLKKSCYGLYDASRQWFLAVKEQLQEIGMKSLSGDDALFYLVEGEKLLGLCNLHVDDFLIGGTKHFLNLIQQKLQGRFTFGKIEFQKFKFTGLNIEQKNDGIYIDQNEYIQSIAPIDIDKAMDKNEKLSAKKFKEYRGLTGQLSWAAENTRPDIAFDVRELSTRNKAATYDDLRNANKVLKKAQMENVSIRYRKLGNWKELKIVTFTDSSYRNAEESTKSVGGRLITIANRHGEKHGWKSKTIQQVCKSVKSAETRSLELGLEDSIYIAHTFHEIYTGKIHAGQIPVEMKIDSKTLKDSIESTKQVDEKTIRHVVAWIKQQKVEGAVKLIEWISSVEMLADVFTKKNVKTDDILIVARKGNL